MASRTASSTGAVIGDLQREDIIRDYRIAFRSRQVSMLARGEVMLGRAMFGIFGDGKEVAQVALAHAFQPGDVRSGYYRDQTLMFALGLLDVEQFFAQVYANTENAADPASAGRGMNAHFGTRMVDANGDFRPIADELHSSADSSPTGSQMPRLVGLAYASKIYRYLPELHDFTEFSRDGNEIAFGTIGNASCAEGVFWESLNAAGVLQVPMLLSIWDDGYGISVPNELQVTKNDIGALIEGFRRSPDKKDGYELATAPGWDYPGLYETYQRVSALVRREHVPAVVHVDEVTQPLGHSTSGSHERYKSKERLQWEKEHDCLVRMRSWMIREGISTDAELDAAEQEEVDHVRAARDAAWNAYENPIREEATVVGAMLTDLARAMPMDDRPTVERLRDDLAKRRDPLRRDVTIAARRATISARGKADAATGPLLQWLEDQVAVNHERYHTHLVAEGEESALLIPSIPPEYNDSSVELDG